MIGKRIKIALILSGLLFAGLIFLPKTPSMKPSRLIKNLPESFSSWQGEPREPGAKEKQILAKDTEFERMHYVSNGYGKAPVEVSVVFSGKSVNQSIHRPEICLRAQGWEFVKENNVIFDELLQDGEVLPLRELVCRFPLMRRVGAGEDAELEPVLLSDGTQAYRWRIFYYTFIGHSDIVSGHYARTLQDIKTRVAGGYDQRWAYATFSVPLTADVAEEIRPYVFPGIDVLDHEETKSYMKDFLKELLPIVIKNPKEGVDATLDQPSLQ